jgi:hypothetical protein
MTAEAKQKVCIHCRQPEGVEPVGVVEGGQEVGTVYCCTACRGRMEGYAMDIFLYGPDDENSGRVLH